MAKVNLYNEKTTGLGSIDTSNRKIELYDESTTPDTKERRVLSDVLALASGGSGWTVSATAPSSPTDGQGWYDTANDVLKIYDGSIWEAIGSGGSTSSGSGETLTEVFNGNIDLSSNTDLKRVSDTLIAAPNQKWVIFWNPQSDRLTYTSYILYTDIFRQLPSLGTPPADSDISIITDPETVASYFIQVGTSSSSNATGDFGSSGFSVVMGRDDQYRPYIGSTYGTDVTNYWPTIEPTPLKIYRVDGGGSGGGGELSGDEIVTLLEALTDTDRLDEDAIEGGLSNARILTNADDLDDAMPGFYRWGLAPANSNGNHGALMAFKRASASGIDIQVEFRAPSGVPEMRFRSYDGGTGAWRDWSPNAVPPEVSQAIAEAGTSTDIFSWTPQRIAQAIQALARPLIATWARASGASGTIPDARIPSSIARDSEVTTAVSNRLQRSDIVAGTNITLANGAGNAVTINAAGGGGSTQTGPQIVALLEALTGTARLDEAALEGGLSNARVLTNSDNLNAVGPGFYKWAASVPTNATGTHGALLAFARISNCLLYTSPSPRDRQKSRMPSSA